MPAGSAPNAVPAAPRRVLSLPLATPSRGGTCVEHQNTGNGCTPGQSLPIVCLSSVILLHSFCEQQVEMASQVTQAPPPAILPITLPMFRYPVSSGR